MLIIERPLGQALRLADGLRFAATKQARDAFHPTLSMIRAAFTITSTSSDESTFQY
jgi:hypothetical protein